MPDPEKVLSVVREWVAKAENDLKTAAHTLKLGKDCPTDTVCFHAQQCVEKYLKALLVWKGIDFPKTHDLEKLIGMLPARRGRVSVSRSRPCSRTTQPGPAIPAGVRSHWRRRGGPLPRPGALVKSFAACCRKKRCVPKAPEVAGV